MRNISVILVGVMGCGLDVTTRGVIDSGATDTAGITDTADTTDTDTDTDTDIDMNAVAINAVSPGYAPLGGGDSVLISGGPFADGAVVTFGGVEAEVTLVTANEIVATIPAQEEAGLVDVQVIMGASGGELKEGFYYFENAANLGGALGWSSWSQLTGGYWNGSYNAGYIAFLFIQPLDLHTWQLTAPEMDSCVLAGDYNYGNIYILDIGADELSLVPQVGDPVSITYNPDSLFYELNPATEQDFVEGAWYDLGAVEGGILNGLNGIDDFYRNTNPPEVIEPAISGDYPPTIYPDQTFRWTAGNNDWIEISMAIYDATLGENIEQINCVAADDGEFQIDPTLFTMWSSGTQINVYFKAVREGGGTLPFNYSESRIAGEFQLIGAGFSQ